MKRVLSTLLLVLALAPLLLLMRWNDEAKAPWSRSNDGVRTRLSAPRFLWKHGEAPKLSLWVRAKETRTFDVAQTIEIVVQHSGREVARYGPVPVGGAPVTVEGGERAEIVLPFAPILNDGPGLYTALGRVGTWELRTLKFRVVEEKGESR